MAARALPFVVGACLCAGLLACQEAPKDTHPDLLLSKRIALFKQFTRAMEPIGLVANGRKEYQPDAFVLLAQDLEKLSGKPWIYFPADGNYPPTRARPEVWSQPDAFKQAQTRFMASVQTLVQTAHGGKREDVLRAVGAVVNSCKACHQDFRKD